MSKCLTVVYAIYVLCLSFVPCSDGFMSHNHDTNGIVEVHNHSHSEGEDDSHVDLCTPFCSCSCCGISIIKVVDSYEVPLRQLIDYRYETSLKTLIQQENLHSIWDPPKYS